MVKPTYKLLDPRPRKLESPYTFYLPSAEELAEVSPGVIVKLMFSAIPASEKYDAERMWVEVNERQGDQLIGTLDNDPSDIPGLTCGDAVEFELHHIIAVYWEDPNLKARFSSDFDNWFARCFVDPAVLEGRARVGFLYREDPEHEEGDKYPDTGWRIRADVMELSDAEYEAYDEIVPEYVAIGSVLNRDDSILSVLGAPTGSRFVRDEKTGVFIEDDD